MNKGKLKQIVKEIANEQSDYHNFIMQILDKVGSDKFNNMPESSQQKLFTDIDERWNSKKESSKLSESYKVGKARKVGDKVKVRSIRSGRIKTYTISKIVKPREKYEASNGKFIYQQDIDWDDKLDKNLNESSELNEGATYKDLGKLRNDLSIVIDDILAGVRGQNGSADTKLKGVGKIVKPLVAIRKELQNLSKVIKTLGTDDEDRKIYVRSGHSIKLSEVVTEEEIPGGVSSGKNPQEIADMHGVSLDQIHSQLKIGTKVELEHTPNLNIAAEIALDHLVEDPEYYDKLATIDPHENN